ncbi:hypothetical protein ABIB66_006699 [Bradyrhizobium sp. F1.13.3]
MVGLKRRGDEVAAADAGPDDRRRVIRKRGARLPTYRLTTRNGALIAALLAVIEYRLQGGQVSGCGWRPLLQLQQRGGRPA